MNILLDTNNVAQFVGSVFTVTDTCVILGDGAICNDLNTSNTTVIDTEPPVPPLGGVWKWENNAWVCINQEAIDEYYANQKAQFNAEQKKKRHAAYIAESDPIFFKSQRGEATNQEWLDKIAEIDARFPYKE